MFDFIYQFKRKWQFSTWKKSGIKIGKNFLWDDNVSLNLASPFFNIPNGKLSIKDNCKISRNCIIDCYGGDVSIGNNVFLGPNCVLYGHGNIRIGDYCLIAMGCKIISANHTIPVPGELIMLQPDIIESVVIGNDVWLGADVKVLAGVTIGDGCIVGAGSVVKTDLPPNSISVGVPARVLKFR